MLKVHLFQNTTYILEIPQADIKYSPPSAWKVKTASSKKPKVFLCKHYSIEHPEDCQFHTTGDCRHVHADLTRAVKKFIHVKTDFEKCEYDRHEGSQMHTIFMPNAPLNPSLGISIPAYQIIKTRCVLDPALAPCHCAHFLYHRECQEGPLCSFAHVVFMAGFDQQIKRLKAKLYGKNLLAAAEREHQEEQQLQQQQFQEQLPLHHDYHHHQHHLQQLPPTGFQQQSGVAHPPSSAPVFITPPPASVPMRHNDGLLPLPAGQQLHGTPPRWNPGHQVVVDAIPIYPKSLPNESASMPFTVSASTVTAAPVQLVPSQLPFFAVPPVKVPPLNSSS